VAWRVSIELGEGVATRGKRKGQVIRKRWTRIVRGLKDDAEAIRATKEAEVLAGTFVPRNVATVKDWLEVWLEDYAPLRAGVGTVEGYAGVCRRHITPALGSIRLTELTPDAVQQFYRKQQDKGLAAQTVLHQHRILNAALKRAVRVGRLSWNPIDRVDPPRIREEYQPNAIDAAETVEVLAKLEGGELYVPAMLAVRCSLRRGEVLALRWTDVDLDGCRLRVERACDPSKANRGGYKPPKSKKGRRMVPFGVDVQAALRAHRKAQKTRRLRLGVAYQEHGLVVSHDDGTPWDPSRFSNAWTKARQELGIEVTFRELRHSYASQLAGLGVPLGVAQALMGHADPMTTQRVYTHTLDGQLEDAAARQAAAIKAAATQAQAGAV
jgi:integrase